MVPVVPWLILAFSSWATLVRGPETFVISFEKEKVISLVREETYGLEDAVLSYRNKASWIILTNSCHIL